MRGDRETWDESEVRDGEEPCARPLANRCSVSRCGGAWRERECPDDAGGNVNTDGKEKAITSKYLFPGPGR